MSSIEIMQKETEKVLTKYFKTLVDDGLLEEHSVTPNDIYCLANEIAGNVMQVEMEIQSAYIDENKDG